MQSKALSQISMGVTHPSSSSADTEELVHRARAVMGPTVKSSG